MTPLERLTQYTERGNFISTFDNAVVAALLDVVRAGDRFAPWSMQIEEGVRYRRARIILDALIQERFPE